MWAYDNFVSKIQDQNIDDPIVRQQLKQAFKDIAKTDEGADYFDNQQSIPKTYFNEKMLPELMKMDVTTRWDLLKVLQDRKNDLASLVENIHSTMTFAPRKWMVAQELRTTIPGTIGTTLLETKYFIDSVAWLQNGKEREQALLMEVYDRAKRVQAKFDNYVWKGDGKQYGSWEWTIQNFMSWDDVVEFYGEEGKNQARAEVEDTDKDKIEDILQMLTDKAKNPTDTSVDFSTMWGKNINLGNKINQLAEMASYLDALERGIDDAEQWWVWALASLPADIAWTLINWVKPSNITNAVSSLSTVVIAIVAWRKWWITKERLKWLLWKWTPSTTAEWGIPESKDKTVTIKGKEYYNPKSDSYKELETSVRSEIEKLKNPPTGTAAISEAEANTRLAKAIRFLENYKTKFLNGHAPYDKTEFGVKLNKIVKGETIIIPTSGKINPLKNSWQLIDTSSRPVQALKNAVTSPVQATKEALALTKEGFSGKGWNLSARMAAITSAESFTAGNKNEPFKIGTDNYTFKWDHAEVSKRLTEIKDYIKTRTDLETWEQAERDLATANTNKNAALARRAELIKSGWYFATNTQQTQQNINWGTSKQKSTARDLSDAWNKVQIAIEEADKAIATHDSSVKTYQQRFVDYNPTAASGATPISSSTEALRINAQAIQAKINSAITSSTHKITFLFDETRRGINLNKFLEKFALTLKK